MTTALVNVATLEVWRIYFEETVPAVILWPNGDASHAPAIGDERVGYRFVEVVNPPPPGEFYSADSIKPELNATQLVNVRAWVPNDIGSVQGTLCDRLDAAAEKMRLAHITPGSGQVLVYHMKRMEAEAYLADNNPDASSYPLLSASIIGTAALADTVKNIVTASNAWTTIAAAIEKTRLDGKAAVRAATDIETAVAAFNAVTWPS